MMKHLKRFVAITISMVMAFQFCTNDFYLYAETGTTDPGQTQETPETGTDNTTDASDPGGGSTDTTTSPETGTEPSAPVEEQPVAPVEEQPGTPVEEQPEVAGTLKVEFVGTDKETVEQALESKYVGNTIRLDELGIDTNIEGYTLTEVKDKNDSTQVYTTETKDFVLTGNVTELQFVYTQNVQTDQPEDLQEPSTPQGGQEDQEDTDESSKDEEISKVVLLKNLLVEDSIDVVIDGVESVEKMRIDAGSIPNESCEIPGYVFQYAQTSNGNSLNYVGMNNGEIYYSLLNDESDYYQPATKLGKDESIVLVYAKVGYQINLSIDDGGNAENTVDCPEETLDGQGFTLKTTTARGYKAEVKVNGSVIEGEDGVYTIDADTAKPAEGSNVISVEVTFTKQETYSYWVAKPEVENWHSASWDGIGNEDNKLTFDSGNTFDFRFSTTDGVVGSDRIFEGAGSETIYRLNSFQINGYDVQVPSTYNVGATESTTLPSGTIVTITCVTAPEYHDYGWLHPRNHWNPANYTYEVTISNAMEDIVVTGGNFRGKDWAEVMVLDITGVQLEIYDGREWQEAKRSTPYAYNNSTQKSFRYKVLPGYGNAVVNIANNSGTIVNESFEDGYYYFTIDRGNNTASYLSVQATPINYSVKYDGGENSSNIPEDKLIYSISNAEGTTDTIYVSNQIPTMKGKVFNGWKIGDNTYFPGQSVSLEEVAIYATENVLTFTAQWVNEDEGTGLLPYYVEVYREVDNGAFELIEKTGYYTNKGQEVTVINLPHEKEDLVEQLRGLVLNTKRSIPSIKVINGNETIQFWYCKDTNNNGEPDEDESYDITINYVFAKGEESDDVTLPGQYHLADQAVGYKYTVKSPAVTGYVAVPTVVSGTVVKADITETVKYYKDANGDGTPDVGQYVTLTFKSEHGFAGEAGNTVELPNQVPGLSFKAPTPTDTETDGVVFVGWDNGLAFDGNGTVPQSDMTYTAQYKADTNNNGEPDEDESYDITINYVFAKGEESDDVTLPGQYHLADQAVGYKYTVKSPAVTGYVAVPTVVSGTVVKADITETVKYYKDANGDGTPDVDETKYTIHYISGTEDTVSGMPENVTDVLKDTEQNVSTVVPVRSGYIFTGWTTDDVAVTKGRFMMPAKDVTFTATWTLDEDENGTPDDEEALVTFNVVNGTFEDGSTSRSMKYNLNTVLSENDIPTVVASSGYTGGNWNTTINGFVVRENVVFTYTFDRINIPVDPTDPDDGTDEPTTPTTPTTPPTTPTTPTTPPTTPTTSPATPGTPGTTTDDGATTDEPEVEEVEDEETPLSDGDVEDVEDNATPKGNNGIWALINLIAAIVTVILGLILLLSKRHRNDEEEDEEERQARIERGEEKEQEQKRGWICKVLGVIVAIASVVFFILTEDMSLPMALTDKWTIWMIVIAIVELVLVLVGRHWKDVDDEDQEQQA